jgi:uncharacterized protein with GYD domain
MQTYVILMNLTEKGMKDVKDAPDRVKDAIKSLETAGGKLVSFYQVMGPYDYIAIAEVPSDEAALLQLLGLGLAGYVRTTTYKAFPLETFAEVLKKLP